MTKPDFWKKNVSPNYLVFCLQIRGFWPFSRDCFIRFCQKRQKLQQLLWGIITENFRFRKNLVSRYGDFFDLGMPGQLLGKVQYLQLGTWWGLHIAYYDSMKYIARFWDGMTHVMYNYLCIISIISLSPNWFLCPNSFFRLWRINFLYYGILR